MGLPRSQRLRTLFLFCKASFSNSLSDSSVVLCQLEGKGQPEVYEQTSQLLGCHCGAQLAPNSALQIIGTEGGGRLMSLVKSFKDRGFLLLFFAFWFFFLAWTIICIWVLEFFLILCLNATSIYCKLNNQKVIHLLLHVISSSSSSQSFPLTEA